MAWGVSPTWPITAMPASVMALAADTLAGMPPSILTASMPPDFRNCTALFTACRHRQRQDMAQSEWLQQLCTILSPISY